MPAAANANKHTWAPIGPAKGGHYTNATSHDNDPDSTRCVLNAVIDSNRWIAAPYYAGFGLASPPAGTVDSLEVFNRYSGVTQSITTTLVSGMSNPVGGSRIFNQTTGVLIRGPATPMPTFLTGKTVFATVKNRLYMANGLGTYTGGGSYATWTDLPTISPDATASSCIPWGYFPQVSNLTYQIVASGTGNNASVVGGSQGTCTVAGANVFWASGVKFDYFQVGATIYINGLFNTIATWVSTTHITVTNVAGAATNGPFSYAPTGLIGNANYTGTGGVQATGTVTGTTTLTWNTGVNFSLLTVGSTIYLTGVANTVASITSATVLILGTPVGNAAYNLSYGTIAGGTTVQGLSTLTTWAPTGGLPIFFQPGPPQMPANGNACFIAGAASPATPSVKYTISSITGTNSGVISPSYAEATGGAQVTRNTQINISNITFDNGRSYQYAVSFYAPSTGHVSNTSPVLNVKDGAPNNVNVSVTISNIATTNDALYTKIILWRSAVGGGQLFPLAILNNDTGNAPLSTITYTDFLGDDTALGTATGGPGKLSAPLSGQNSPPPADLTFITYWDGRFWGASSTQIGLLFFSCRVDANTFDTTVGVPEECWPALFTRAIPESDGRITGLRTVGNTLVVLTDNNMYSVYGSQASNYGLSRIPTKGRGTSHFATTVIPAGDLGTEDVLVHFGNDSRLYFLGGSGDFPISYPIQNSIGTTPGNTVASGVVLSVVHNGTSGYVVMGLPSTAQQPGEYWYDLERQVWFLVANGALASANGASARVEGLYNGVITTFLGFPTTASATGVGYIKYGSGGFTPMGFITSAFSPGGDRLDEKILQALIIYTTISGSVTVKAGWDDDVSTNDANPLNMTTYTSTMVEVANSGNYGAYFETNDARVFVPQTTFARGRVFQFSVLFASVSAGDGTAVRKVVAVFGDQTAQTNKGANL